MVITLIGMPGSGKSTVGKELARQSGLRFVDVDRMIEREEGRTLSRILDDEGDDGFRAVEERVNASIEIDQAVLAPGGSVVYGEKAMAHLRALGPVVYLRIGEAQLLRRLGDLHARGVTIRPGQTFHDLYDERCPLYERYATLTVDAGQRPPAQLAEEIRRQLNIGT